MPQIAYQRESVPVQTSLWQLVRTGTKVAAHVLPPPFLKHVLSVLQAWPRQEIERMGAHSLKSQLPSKTCSLQVGIEYDIVDMEVEGVETLFLPSGGDVVAKAATDKKYEVMKLRH